MGLLQRLGALGLAFDPDIRPIFMTIFYPYPQHANMEVEEDVECVARWLGSIVRPAYLEAFYYKPSVSTTTRLLRETFSPLSLLAPRVATHTHVYAPLWRPHVWTVLDGWHIMKIIWNVRY